MAPTLISKQGAGKGNYVKFMSKMLGPKKVLETQTPSRDVWGNFNGLMADDFFLNLDKLSKKDTAEVQGSYKGLITKP